VLFAGPLSHNSFPVNHLPFVLPWPKLGLFGAEAQGAGAEGAGAEGAGVPSLTSISETRSDLTHRPVDLRAWARLAWTCASVVLIFLLLSNHKSQFMNHKSEGVPLPVGRVAGIVPEFWARGRRQNPVTPCARRNRRFFARGVFYLFNCCTDGTQIAGNGS